MFKMKINQLKLTSIVMAIMLFISISACNSGQQEKNTAEETESTEMNEMEGMDMSQQKNEAAAADTQGEPAFLQDYMQMKNAMVNDNYEQAKQAASKMQNSLEDSELSQEQQNKLKKGASQLAEAQDIEAQRQAFDQLSQQLYQVVQNKDVTDKPLYWQHCAMAMDGQGANWLSYEEQVNNPYMGQRMPRCGSMEETINQ